MTTWFGIRLNRYSYLIFAMVLLIVGACSPPQDALPTVAQLADEQPTDAPDVSTDAPTDIPAEIQNASDPNSFAAEVSGLYETSIPYITFEFADEPDGVYELRFHMGPDDDDNVLNQDFILVLPGDIEEGIYEIEPGTSNEGQFIDLDPERSQLTVNLSPPGEPSIAGASTDITGEVMIAENTGGMLTGNFRIVITGTTGETIIDGEMTELSGSVEP